MKWLWLLSCCQDNSVIKLHKLFNLNCITLRSICIFIAFLSVFFRSISWWQTDFTFVDQVKEKYLCYARAESILILSSYSFSFEIDFVYFRDFTFQNNKFSDTSALFCEEKYRFQHVKRLSNIHLKKTFLRHALYFGWPGCRKRGRKHMSFVRCYESKWKTKTKRN